jgi:putative membrane protein
MAEDQRKTLVQIMIVLIVAVVGFALVSSLFGGGMMGGGMMGGMGFGWIMMFLPIIFIILLIYALLDRESPSNNQTSYYGNETPMQVLQRRYASGEISRSDYLRMKEDINRR